MGIFDCDGYYDLDLQAWIPAPQVSARSLYRKKRKKLKRKLKKFAPADAEPLKAIFFCEDYEQRSMLINTLWDKITFEVEAQYKIIEQFDPHTEDYQRARARGLMN